jgi:hypothetical protein
MLMLAAFNPSTQFTPSLRASLFQLQMSSRRLFKAMQVRVLLTGRAFLGF